MFFGQQHARAPLAAVTIRTGSLLPQTTTCQKPASSAASLLPFRGLPPGLLNVLTENQILDLLAYLESGGDPKHRDFAP